MGPCALAALHITAPFVPLTLDLVQFEDVQHLTQLKWDLQVGKDYYTGENGPEEKRAIDVCRCIAEIQRRPQLSDISLLQCAQHTRRKPSWPHTIRWAWCESSEEMDPTVDACMEVLSGLTANPNHWPENLRSQDLPTYSCTPT